ncbi:ferredoxin [Streptomyces sp. NPDC007856]|uniref:ferredoxin n=1 Tax=Streptomyces sp. NPDC007856 TaxID=3364781 RepID=UPI00369A62EE
MPPGSATAPNRTNLTRCQGYAQCVFLAPDVFELHGEEGLLYATAVPDDQVERCPMT